LTRSGHSIRRDTCTLDGIDYEVVLLAASGGISARWECKACGANVVNAIPRPTEQEALALAYDTLNNHHIRVHPRVGDLSSTGSEAREFPENTSQNGSDPRSPGD
jgi:hypothetical protein